MKTGYATFLLSAWAFAHAGCGGTTNPPPPPDDKPKPTIRAFSTNKTVVARGATVVLTWDVIDASTVTLEATPGGTLFAGSTNLAGSQESAAVSQNTKFTLSATGDGGTTSQSIDVSIDPSAVEITRFSANPNPVAEGAQTVISWATVGATRVRIESNAREIYSTENAAEVAQGNIMGQPTPPTQTFTLIASNDTKSATKELTIRTELAVDILEFRIRPQLFRDATANVSINWRVENAAQLSLTQDGSPVPNFPQSPTGTISVSVSGTKRFRLTGTNPVSTRISELLVGQAVDEVEPNDTVAQAQAITSGIFAKIGKDDPNARDYDWFAIDVGEGQNVTAQTGDGQGGCLVDTVVTLYSRSGTAAIAENDDGGAQELNGSGRCSYLRPNTPGAGDLRAGTYYLQVRGFDELDRGNYTLAFQVGTPGCGNGVIERSRQEQCDDGNLTSADGCSATCEIEVSGTHNGPGGATQTFVGALDFGLFAYYDIVMSAPGYLYAETFAPAEPACNTDTILRLYDATGRIVGLDEDSGVNGCSKIDSRMPWADLSVGRYRLVVASEDPAEPVGAYTLLVKTTPYGCGNGFVESGEECDDANTTAQDGCSTDCKLEPKQQLVGPQKGEQVFTSSVGVGRMDAYQITLNGAGYVYAETFAPTRGQCSGADSQLTLVDSTGRVLGFDDDSGMSLCSRIDPDVYPWARLSAGRYFVLVSAARANQSVGEYTIVIGIPGVGCGNRFVEAPEECDDGNNTPGDGCDASCHVEVLQTFNPPGGFATFSLPQQGSIATFAVNVTQAGQAITATVSNSTGGACPAVSASLRDPQGNELEEFRSFIAQCAVLQFPQDTFATDLPIGRYAITVEAFEGQTDASRIDVGILNPTCGNGVLERRGGEECDDKNQQSGDGCSSSCRLQGTFVAEVDPNGTTAQATPTGAHKGGHVVVVGSIEPGDKDYWSFEIPQGQTATLNAVSYINQTDRSICPFATGDTHLFLIDANGGDIVDNDDLVESLNYCGALTPATSGTSVQNLAAGRYYIRVQGYNEERRIPQYFMDIELQ